MSGRKMPKILFLDQSGKLGGAELCLLDIAASFADSCQTILFEDGPFVELLQQAGVCTTVISLGGAGNFRKSGGVISALRSFPGFMRTVAKVADRAKSCDVIYANTTKAAIIAAPAARIAKVPLVVHLHDIVSEKHFGRLGRMALVRSVNQASVVIANSMSTQDAFVKAGGNVTHIITIPNGFQPRKFADIAELHRQEIRSSLGVGGHFTVGVFGRIAEWKGQHVLLEALRQLPDVHVVVVGDALFTEADKTYAKHLHDLAAAPGLAGRVHFTGFREDVPLLIHAMDAVVHTSVAPEPFGRVIVEAMLCGKPVVATNAGGPGEILEDGVSGLLVTPSDSAALARAITSMKDNPQQAAQMGKQARKIAICKYDIDNVIAAIADCLSGVSRGLLSQNTDLA